MVHHNKAGIDHQQPVARTVQPYRSTSGPQHATTSPGNPSEEWHRTWWIDSLNNRGVDLIGFSMKVQFGYGKLRQFLHLSIIGLPSKNLFLVLL